jgi:hypothetical protein
LESARLLGRQHEQLLRRRASFLTPQNSETSKDRKRSSEKILENLKPEFIFPPPKKKKGIRGHLCTAQRYAAVTASSAECYKDGKKNKPPRKRNNSFFLE